MGIANNTREYWLSVINNNPEILEEMDTEVYLIYSLLLQGYTFESMSTLKCIQNLIGNCMPDPMFIASSFTENIIYLLDKVSKKAENVERVHLKRISRKADALKANTRMADVDLSEAINSISLALAKKTGCVKVFKIDDILISITGDNSDSEDPLFTKDELEFFLNHLGLL